MIHHVSLETAPGDADACVDFWGLLGFARVDPPPTLRERAVWLQRGTQQLHLLLSDEPMVPPAGHLAVVVSDYERATAALREAGFEVDERARHWGAPRCFVRDPAGHRVELMAFPPGG